MGSWETLPKAKRDRITHAVNEALAAKLTAIANEEGVSPGPPEVDVVTVTGSDEEITVHFVAHKQVRSESLDRDGAAHAIYVGQAVIAPNQPVSITLTEEHCEVFTEQEYEGYAPRPVVQRVYEQVLARVQGVPVPPASDEPARARRAVEDRAREAQRQYELAHPEPAIVYRCPRCGSTRATPDGGVEEYTVMRCPACGLRAFIEQHEIDSDWTVEMFPASGEAIPAFLPPLPPPVAVPEPEHAPIPPLRVEPPAKVAHIVDPTPTPTWPYDEPAENLAGDSWTKDVTDLRCPRCDSTKVYNDTGRAERHFTFFSCRSCDHGEEMSSLSAIGRWRRT